MLSINFQDIHVPDNRQRREFDARKLEELANSIESKGLMHPIVLHNGTLVAGERRLRAMIQLHDSSRSFYCNGQQVATDEIPFVVLGELDPLALREAELEENVVRADLTWQEHAKAVAELHRLRTDQHGAFDLSSREGWKQTDTAEELVGRTPKKHEIQDVGRAIQLEEFLDDPLVAAARNPKEALRMIREEQRRLKRQEASASFDHSTTVHTLTKGDCYELLKRPEYENLFQCIVTDPPYGIDIDKIKFWDNDQHEYSDDEATFQRVCNELPQLLFRAAADQAHAYIFCDIRRFNDLFVGFELAGWDCWPMPLIWAKGNTGSFPNADYGPRRTYEAILYCNKGQRKVTAMYTDVIAITNPGKQLHPAGKPIDVYLNLLKRTVLPGDRVLDAFAGSGPVFPAAHQLECVATGIELNDKYYDMAMERLQETVKK